MNRPQRIVAVLYCLLIVYCCVWVPWHVILNPAAEPTSFNPFNGLQLRIGYGWLWDGPENLGRIGKSSTPDLPIIGLRLLAVTALGGAAFWAAGWKQE